jgi:dethiobiotin synthetase
MNADIHTSVTRIASLEERSYTVTPQPREEWETGDFVVVRVTERPPVDATVENAQGRRVELLEGETIAGAFGTRAATRELVGDWRDVDDDGRMQVLTGGGVLGKVTSRSPFVRGPIEVEYEGHVVMNGDIARMREYGLEATSSPQQTPVVLVLGTSMSAGKTVTGRVLTRVLVEQGYQVGACKLTGAGTYGDALSLREAGAAPVYDFVDAGLPTTVVPEETFRDAIRPVLGHLQDADVIVAEVGASPLEPYNGAAVVDLLEDQVAFTVLCASDPYAVVGVEEAFGWSPDLVAGIATNTSAGIDLVEQLTACSALNLLEEDAKEPLRELLTDALR